MTWLLWREYRLNRWILVTGSALILLAYLIDFIFADNDSWDFLGAWLLSCIFAYLTVALLAGNAIAGERTPALRAVLHSEALTMLRQDRRTPRNEGLH